MAINDVISLLVGGTQGVSYQEQQMQAAQQEAMARMQETINPFSLGTYSTFDERLRTRRDIYSKWEKMSRFAPIAEALGIHITAALGGDSVTNQQVFITPAHRLRAEGNDKTIKSQLISDELRKLEKRIKPLERLINQHIIKICRDAITFGDAYVRVYGEKGKGITEIVANEFTYPPLIQAYEQANQTVAYHELDYKSYRRVISKLNKIQMLRMKMPRITHVPQYDINEAFYISRTLQIDDPRQAPIFAAPVGGSFLYEIERFYDNVILALSTMNSQQIADAVNQAFLSVNMTAMPPAQRKAYIEGLQKLFKDSESYVKSALEGGSAIWNTKYFLLPTTNEKQILTPLGDIRGQRTSPVNVELFMTNVRLMMGGLGLDPSMVGWVDMLSGGLGDGAAFHQSSQIMRRSMMIRQATTDFLNQLIALDWGYCYGETFEHPLDYAWQVEYYSDQSAAMSETLSNQQQRTNNLMMKAQMLQQFKEIGLSEQSLARMLERDGGMDYDEATSIAKDLVQQHEQMQEMQMQQQDDMGDEEQSNDEENNQDDEEGI